MSPKLNRKPTPAEARLLAQLGQYDLAVEITDKRAALVAHDGYWSKDQYRATREHGKPRLTTARSCLAAGWLTLQDEERWKFSPHYILSDTGLALYNGLEPEDLVSVNLGVSTQQIINALRERHSGNEWAFACEVALGISWGSYSGPGIEKPIRMLQRIDAFALNCWPSRSFMRVAYEIKLTRGDFLNEMAHPDKRQAAMLFSNEAYFAAPAGLIKPEELPDQWGLVEVVKGGKARLKVEALYREADEPMWPFVAALARALVDRP